MANISNSSFGVLGVGLPRLEAVKGYDGAPGVYYDNFPQALKRNNIISQVMYSLYFAEGDSSSGQVLFGAVDEKKVDGFLYTLPMVNIHPEIDEPAEFHVTLQGLGIKSASKCQQDTISTSRVPALLDSGTSYVVAPYDIVEAMAGKINAVYSNEEGLFILDCPAANDDTEVYFDFGEVKLKVPLSNFILSPEEGRGYCGFAVLPSEDTWVLGDVFLRSAYVVYDLDNYEISLGQTKYTSDSRIETVRGNKISRTRQSNSTPWHPYGNNDGGKESVFDDELPRKCRRQQTASCSSSFTKRTIEIGPSYTGVFDNSAASLTISKLYILCAVVSLYIFM